MPNWAKPQRDRRHQIVAELCKKFPDTGARTLGRMLNDKHPALFPTLEIGRSAVRQMLGVNGGTARPVARRNGTERAKRQPGQLPELPKSRAKPWKPFVLDARRVLVLSDLHIPYVDDDALAAALEYGDSFRPDAVLLNGDVFDFYQISRHDKDPTVPKIKDELDDGRMFFTHLRKRFPRAGLYFKLGNHDERWGKYLQLKAPELFDVPEIRFAWHHAAGLPANEVKVIDDQRPVMLGKLPVFHGHELGRSMFSPVNPARGAFLRSHHTILVGHSHQTSGHADTNLWHAETFCWSTGCLCDLTPEYARVNRWNHGLATVEVFDDGEFNVSNLRIANGKVRSS